MIGTCFYAGQGFGNQLWVYSVTRSAALRKNCDFAVINFKNFKGRAFLNLDADRKISEKRKKPSNRIPSGFSSVYHERQLFDQEKFYDISPFDEKIAFPSDGTVLEGPMQSENYILEYKHQISEWFKVPGPEFDGCVINIRGGEYRSNADLFLGKEYYKTALEKMLEIDPLCKFLIVTDDPLLAKTFFPSIPVKSSGGVRIFFKKIYISPKSELIGSDFSWIQNAKYLILSNSSFSWWGAWTNTKVKIVIAPKYWARHNVSTGNWSQGDSLTRGWLWLDRKGKLSTYEECARELSFPSGFQQNFKKTKLV